MGFPKRYITVAALITDDKKTIIPLTNPDVIYCKGVDGMHYYIHNNERFHRVDQAVYDTREHKLLFGVEIDIYPDIDRLDFKVGTKVLFEKTHRVLVERTIKEIVYTDFDLSIHKGKKLEKYYKDNIKDIQIEDETMYAIKHWKPYYLLDDGTIVEYNHQLWKLPQSE